MGENNGCSYPEVLGIKVGTVPITMPNDTAIMWGAARGGVQTTTIRIEAETLLEVNAMGLTGVGAIRIQDCGVISCNGITYRQIVIGPVEINLYQKGE